MAAIPLILSDLTWSSCHNVAGILGLDLTVNFWGSFFGGITGSDVLKRYLGSMFDGVSATRRSGFGLRHDGVTTYPGNAWTYQHIVYLRNATDDQSKRVRVVAPGARLDLSHYGTLLRVTPSAGASFVLASSSNVGGVQQAPTWTRGGGAAEPVYPGATNARFPSGGLHLSSTSTVLNGPQDGSVVEIAPTGTFGVGTLRPNLVSLDLPATGLGLAADKLVLLTDAGTGVVIAPVLSATEQGSSTSVIVDTTGAGLAAPVRVRGLGAVLGTDASVTALASPAGRLSTAGTTGAYLAGDPLRLSQGGVVVGAALIQSLETQLTLDVAIPGGLTPPLTVSTAIDSGVWKEVAVTDATTLTFDVAKPPLPAPGDAIMLQSGTTTQPLLVSAKTKKDGELKVDRAITVAAPGASGVKWRPITPVAAVGTRAGAPEATAVLTYAPRTPRAAPTSGLVIIDGAVGKSVHAVTGAAYDALVLGASLPGVTTNPYSVERFPIQTPDQSSASVGQVQALGLSPSIKLEGTALRLLELAGAKVVAGPVGLTLTVAGATLTGSITAPSLQGTPTPGQIMVVSTSGASAKDELALVTEIALTVTLDRTLTVPPSGLEAVPLTSDGSAHDAIQPDPAGAPLTLSALDTVSGASVELPRLAVGEIVQVAWTGSSAGAGNDLFRIAAVEGTAELDSTTVTLEGGAAALPSSLTGLTITRQIARNPGTGSTRDGIRGVAVGATPVTGGVSTNQIRFSVWTPGALTTTGSFSVNGYAIVAGDKTFPVNMTAPRTITLTLGAKTTFADGTAVTLSTPALNAGASTAYSATFTQKDAVVFAEYHPDNTALNAGTGNLVVAVPFKELDKAAKATASLTPATVLIPEDTSYELTEREGVMEHELRHTQQSAMWGPWLLGFVPVQPIFEMAFPGLDLPKFSRYIEGKIGTSAGKKTVTFQKPEGVPVEKGDSMQAGLFSFRLGETVALETSDPADAKRFFLEVSDSAATFEGGSTIQARRVQDASGWAKFFGRSLPQLLTLGGLTKLAVGSTWGAMLYGVGRAAYALGKVVTKSAGVMYPAEVALGGEIVSVTDAAAREALKNASRVLIRKDKSTVVRAVVERPKIAATPPETEHLRLGQTVDWTGTIEIAPYSTHMPGSHWDWHDYYPAKVPDPDKPATIQLLAPAEGKETLKLELKDEVWILSGTQSATTTVTAVNADGTYDLASFPRQATGAEGEFRIAKIASDDPLGSLGGLVSKHLEASWVRYATDPYGALLPRIGTKPGSFWDGVVRVGRWLTSTHSWSMLPMPGWFIIDNVWARSIGQGGYLSQMEQDASEESGDLYSPIGRLEGSPWGVVGDIARYRYFLSSRTSSVYTGSQLDAPGVQVSPVNRLLPFVTAEAAGGADPNRGAATPLSTSVPAPGNAVPSALVLKDGSGLGATGTSPLGFVARDQGWVPMSPRLERVSSLYCAFTRAGAHRVTVQDGITGATNARDVQDRGAGPTSKKVTLFFNQTVGDVAVTVAGVTVAAQDPPASISLLIGQRAPIRVSPGGERRYAVTVMRPVLGKSLRADDVLTLRAGLVPTKSAEPAEVCRVYRYDAKTSTFDAPVLSPGVHLPRDLRIPVRTLRINVTDTLAVRKAVSTSSADDIASLKPGQDGFVLIPSAIVVPLAATLSYPGTKPPATVDPALAFTSEPVPAALADAKGDGAAFRIHLDVQDPPEEPATAALTVEVGLGGQTAVVKATLKLDPHFMLALSGGATAFEVKRGSKLDLAGQEVGSSTSVNVASPTASDPSGLTLTASGATLTIQADATAALGKRRILVERAGNATQKAARTITVVA